VELPPQPIASIVSSRTRIASGRAPAKRCLRVRAKRRRSALNNIIRRDTGKSCGREMKRIRGHMGGAKPRAMVVTVTVAVPLPEVNMLGVTLQVVVAVTAAGRAQDRLTWDEKPL
jgi:hypothetical protein